MLRTGGHDIDSRGIDAAVAQNIRQLGDVLFDTVECPGKQLAQIMGKNFGCRYSGLSAKLLHLPPDAAPVQWLAILSTENHAAGEIRTILEDYRKYGLMCRLNETDRETIFGFSCIFMAFSVAAGYMLYQLKHWFPIACLAVFLPAGLFFLYRWHQDNQIAKQLARLKGKK